MGCLLSTPSRTRTADKLIKSQLLYQLSYGGTLSVSTLHLLLSLKERAAGQI